MTSEISIEARALLLSRLTLELCAIRRFLLRDFRSRRAVIVHLALFLPPAKSARPPVLEGIEIRIRSRDRGCSGHNRRAQLRTHTRAVKQHYTNEMAISIPSPPYPSTHIEWRVRIVRRRCETADRAWGGREKKGRVIRFFSFRRKGSPLTFPRLDRV